MANADFDNDMDFDVVQEDAAFHSYLVFYKVYPTSHCADVQRFLSAVKDTTVRIVNDELVQKVCVKLWLCLVVCFEKTATDTDSSPLDEIYHYFADTSRVCLSASLVEEVVSSIFSFIVTAVEAQELRGSGLRISRIESLNVHIAKYEPLTGKTYVALPAWVRNKRAVINPKNYDNKCFQWAVMIALSDRTTRKHVERVSEYIGLEGMLDFAGIPFPVSIEHVPVFERLNEMTINVFGCSKLKNSVRPLYISKSSYHPVVNLLLYGSHYCFISDLDRLLSHERNTQHKNYFCPTCMRPIYTKEKFERHVLNCKSRNVEEVMPEAGSVLSFKNHKNKIEAPVLICADVECVLRAVSGCQPNPNNSYTIKTQKHEAYAFGMLEFRTCCGQTTVGEYKSFTGSGCCERFLEELLNTAKNYHECARREMKMQEGDRLKFETATVCWICEGKLESLRVRDHCHLCGQYRGAAHSVCNQKLRVVKDVTVVFHNLRRYDSHLIMQSIGRLCNVYNCKLECIARGIEDYVTFSVRPRSRRTDSWKIRFVDSCQFLPASLDTLVSGLDPTKLRLMDRFFGENANLLKRKGVFAYEYFSDESRLAETSLPDISKFYSSLTDDSASSEDYSHAQNVWQKLEIKSLGQYLELYLKTDVILLGEIMSNFRSMAMQVYGLDPVHYCTLPAFAFDVCLKVSNIKLDLLSDIDLHRFFEKAIRGGVSMISHRYAEANNPYLNDYDHSKPTSYIIDVDANNLYGEAMCRPLPTGNFRELSGQEVKQFDFMDFDVNGSVGCFLSVDFDYPEHLHDLHNCYPLAPQSIEIDEGMISPYCIKLSEKLKQNVKPVVKLTPTLLNKSEYILHIKNLQLYVSLGMRVSKIHRVVLFDQSSWLKPYIELNTAYRKEAKTDFERDFFKLLNNSVFGKFMENVRKRVKVELVVNAKEAARLVKKPNFDRFSIFTSDLAAMVMQPEQLKLNRPGYLGAAILDLSKDTMYAFHYGYIVPRFGSAARLLKTDTDSLGYEVKTADIYRDIEQDIDRYFDTSDYPEDHFLHSTKNKKKLGMMKDETAGVPIKSFCGLRAKMYALAFGDVEKKRAKGVKKCIVKRRLRFRDYFEVLRQETSLRHRMTYIRSFKHELYTIKQSKKSLSAYDDKRYILPDGITSYAYGHWRIKELNKGTAET